MNEFIIGCGCSLIVWYFVGWFTYRVKNAIDKDFEKWMDRDINEFLFEHSEYKHF